MLKYNLVQVKKSWIKNKSLIADYDIGNKSSVVYIALQRKTLKDNYYKLWNKVKSKFYNERVDTRKRGEFDASLVSIVLRCIHGRIK